MKKMMTGIGMAVIIVVLVIGVLIWNKPERVEFEGEPYIESQGNNATEIISVLSSAENIEEAEKIADLYGITLVKFSNGVAVYETNIKMSELKKLGEENGYPTLEYNYVGELH